MTFNGQKILFDQIKNGIFYGVGIAVCGLIFLFSDGGGFLFLIAWFLTSVIGILAFLSAFNTIFALALLPISIPLYFDKSSDKLDRFYFDLSTIVGTAVNLGVLLAAYQTIQQYGKLNIPEFFPFGNIFSIYNFAY